VFFRTEVVAVNGDLVNGGYVTFASCTAPVVNGAASCSYTGNNGRVSTAARYSGTSVYAPSTSPV